MSTVGGIMNTTLSLCCGKRKSCFVPDLPRGPARRAVFAAAGPPHGSVDGGTMDFEGVLAS